VAAGRLGFGVGRVAGDGGGGVDVGSGRAVALLEGDRDALGVGVTEGDGANGSGAGAAGAGSGAGGVLAGEGIASAEIVGVAAATEAESGGDVTRTPRNPTTGIASAIPVAMRIRRGRCTMPPTVIARPHAVPYGGYARDRIASNIGTSKAVTRPGHGRVP
jgi:hypothetical protein